MKILIVLLSMFLCISTSYAYCDGETGEGCGAALRDAEQLGTLEEQLRGLRINSMIDPYSRGTIVRINGKTYRCLLRRDDSIDCESY